MTRFISEVNTCSNHKDNEAKANEGDLQSNSFVDSMEISSSIPWDPRIKGRARKKSWTVSSLKWASLARDLQQTWSSGIALGKKRFLSSSKEFLFLYHYLIRITYEKIAVSPCHFPQTLRRRWKFRSRDVKSSLIQPEHWSLPATLPCIIPT